MARRRRERRPGDQREGAGQSGPPRVGPDGRQDDRPPRQPNAYTPPASPLTRWQGHAGGQRGAAANPGRSRWSADGAGTARNERRRFAPGGAPPTGRRHRVAPEGRPANRPNIDRSAPLRPTPPTHGPNGTINAFELFCAYHLGITTDDGYRIQNIHEVARRFGINAAELRQVLADLGMAADDIVHSGFDLPSAQVDIMVAPEGISRRELARPLYEEFRGTPKQTRNWAREMEDAQRRIDETIGRDGHWSPTPRDPTGKQS
jgi:hypothetical protein